MGFYERRSLLLSVLDIICLESLSLISIRAINRKKYRKRLFLERTFLLLLLLQINPHTILEIEPLNNLSRQNHSFREASCSQTTDKIPSIDISDLNFLCLSLIAEIFFLSNSRIRIGLKTRYFIIIPVKFESKTPFEFCIIYLEY